VISWGKENMNKGITTMRNLRPAAKRRTEHFGSKEHTHGIGNAWWEGLDM